MRVAQRAARHFASVAPPWPDAALPLAAAAAPPPAWCVDGAVFQAEAAALFPRWWHPVAPAADLVVGGGAAAVGARVAGQPLLVTTGGGGAGRLACFENACPHQGSLLAPLNGQGCPLPDATLTCKYHGWRFRADGRLAAAPGVGGIESFQAKAWGLRPGGTAASWGAVVFAALGQGGDGSDDLAPPVSPSASAALAAAGIPTTPDAAARYAVVARRTFTVRANWKVVVANYCDG